MRVRQEKKTNATARRRHPDRSQGGSAGSHSRAYPALFGNSCELRVARLCPLPATPPAGGSKVSALLSLLFCWGCKVSLLLRSIFALVHFTSRGTTGSTSSTGLLHLPPPSVSTLTAPGAAVDLLGSPSRGLPAHTRAPPSATAALLFQQAPHRRFLPLHCCITFYLRPPYATLIPTPPLRVPASRPSTSMPTPGSSFPTPPLVEVHPQPLGARY